MQKKTTTKPRGTKKFLLLTSSDINVLTFVNVWAVGWMSICFLCLVQPFMEMWMGVDNMYPILTVVILSAYLYLWKFKDVLSLYKNRYFENFVLFGGYPGAERKILCVYSEEKPENFPIKILKLEFNNKEYLLKGYNSVTPFVVDEKILIRANLMRMYLGMIMMVEPCTRWKKGSLIYWGRIRIGKRLFNKAINELEKQL